MDKTHVTKEDTKHTFAHEHLVIHLTIEQWIQEQHSVPHPFKIKWTELKYKGLTAHTSWDKIRKITQCTTYQTYLNLVQQCPAVVDQYNISWDPNTETMKCTPRILPTIPTVRDIYNTTMRYYDKIKTLAFYFDSTAQSIKHKIDDYTTQIASLETKLLCQGSTAQERFGKYTKQAQDAVLQQLDQKMAQYMEDMTTQTYNDFQNRLDDVASNLYSNAQRTLDNMTASAKESWDQTINKAKDSLKELLPENTKPPDQPAVVDSTKQDRAPRFPIHRRSVLFPNVDILAPQKPQAQNPYADPPQSYDPAAASSTVHEPKPTPHQDDEEEPRDRFGPGPNHSQNNPQPLPYIQPHKLVTHVKVPYTGKESSYTWYQTFRSAVRQYGILLISVEDFKKNKSLCPRQHLGSTINTARYCEMADPYINF